MSEPDVYDVLSPTIEGESPVMRSMPLTPPRRSPSEEALRRPVQGPDVAGDYGYAKQGDPKDTDASGSDREPVPCYPSSRQVKVS